jgi:hypothetical protein
MIRTMMMLWHTGVLLSLPWSAYVLITLDDCVSGSFLEIHRTKATPTAMNVSVALFGFVLYATGMV